MQEAGYGCLGHPSQGTQVTPLPSKKTELSVALIEWERTHSRNLEIQQANKREHTLS